MVRNTFSICLILDSGYAFRWFWGLNILGIFSSKNQNFSKLSNHSLSSLNEKVIFSKFKLLISIWNMNFGSNFNVMLKTKSTFSEEKLDFWDTTEQSWNCWCLRGWCYEIITFMRISISKTSRYVVSKLLLLEISISAFVLESLGSRSESRHEESVCIFLMLLWCEALFRFPWFSL